MTVDKINIPRVLVVEDDEAARYMIREALEQHGFAVEEAHNGLIGLRKFKACTPDLILTDVMMPHMDGFGFCQKIRSQSAGKYTPILIMTALEDYESINRAYEVGATDFITKPISYLLLAHRLQYMLRAKRTADELRTSKSRLAKAQCLAKIGHWEIDLDSGQMRCSDELLKLLEVPDSSTIESMGDFIRYIVESDREEFVNKFIESKKNKTGYTIEQRIKTHSGVLIHILNFSEHSICPVSGEGVLTGAIQDITQRKRVEQQIELLSYYDKLTGLPNRHYFTRNLRQALFLASRNTRNLAVLFLNLDRFERINNSLGHDAGDELLLKVKHRLLDCVRKSDMVAQGDRSSTLAHLGGDDFVVLIPEISSAESTGIVARRIIDALSEPIQLQDNEITITSSIGISVFPDDGNNEGSLMNNAGTALKNAKVDGGSCFKFYTKEMNVREFKNLSLEANLRRALEENQFQLYYQPKISLSSGSVYGAEALIRWQHPDTGIVSPAEFIPFAESSGLIIPMGEWVIAEATRQLAKWADQGVYLKNLSINLSAKHVHDINLIELIQNCFDKNKIEPSCFEIEVTESMVMDDVDRVIPILEELRATGLAISIDDFGTGYSSLSYLKRLPINTIKIDQSFIRDLHSNSDDKIIVDAIIALSHSMNLKVVAEGVELQEQAEILSNKSCDFVQGYFYSRPVTAEKFKEWYLEMQITNNNVAKKMVGVAH